MCIDFNTCETMSVDAFKEILILDMILNDATTWYDSIYIYVFIMSILYDDLYMRVLPWFYGSYPRCLQ